MKMLDLEKRTSKLKIERSKLKSWHARKLRRRFRG